MTDQQARAPRGWLGAGTAYVAIVFLIAFVLGAVRVMLVAPRLGPIVAVLLETPLILTVSWLASAWCVRTFRVPPAAVPRLAMGGTALVLLMLLELGVSILLFSRPLSGYLADFRSLAGAIGLAAQVAFAFVPLLQIRRSGAGR